MRNANPRPLLTALCLLLTVNGTLAATTRTVVLTSAPFSLGYGWTWDHTNPPNWTNGWTTMETASVNTPTNQGAFTLSPVFQSAQFGSIGVEFPGRVLADGVTFGYRATAGSSAFQAAITATWNGDLPEDAAPDPDLRIRFVITQISLHACGTSTQTTPRSPSARPLRNMEPSPTRST